MILHIGEVGEKEERVSQLRAGFWDVGATVNVGPIPEQGGKPIERNDADDPVIGKGQGTPFFPEQRHGLPRHDEAA